MPLLKSLGRRFSHSYSIYFGSQLMHSLQALDIETVENPVSYRCQV